jgi:hypothetical protein
MVDWICTFAYPYVRDIETVTVTGKVKTSSRQKWNANANLAKRVAVLQVKNLVRARNEKERQIEELNSELSSLINTMLRKERQIKALGQVLE